MKEKYQRGLVLDPATGELRPVSRGQYIQQWIYGVVEPLILRATMFMLNDPVRSRLFNKMATPKALPREVVVSTEAACRFVDFIYRTEAGTDCPRMAVTKCVCQTATGRFREPVEKDMALLYTANLYTTAKHTGIGEPYRIIETAEEAKQMLHYFDECGLVHTIMYCHSSGRWTFVICNCDDEICVPVQAYKAGRRDQVLAGPEIAWLDPGKCIGCAECGACLDRCIFGANAVGPDGKSTLDPAKCLGCGLCVPTCPAGARMLVRRKDYQHEDKLTTRILLG